jgi:hypothetical protein
VSWPAHAGRRADQLAAARNMTCLELASAADGCTEITCTYHGAINEVRRERQRPAANSDARKRHQP